MVLEENRLNLFMMKIAKRVKETMTPISDIANLMGVQQSVVYSWLNGTSLPKIKNLVLLSSILGEDINSIYGDGNINNEITDFLKEFANYKNYGHCDNKVNLIKGYITTINQLRRMYINKAKGFSYNKDLFSFALSVIEQEKSQLDAKSIVEDAIKAVSSIKDNTIEYKDSLSYDFHICKIYKIDPYFDINNVDFIYETLEYEKPKVDFANPEHFYDKVRKKYLADDKIEIKYSDKPYKKKINNCENHKMINDNTYYVLDSNNYAAIIELINLEEISYDKNLFDIYSFDKVYNCYNFDEEILKICKNNTELLKKYFDNMPMNRFIKLKEEYIKSGNKSYQYGDIFLICEYEKNNNVERDDAFLETINDKVMNSFMLKKM